MLTIFITSIEEARVLTMADKDERRRAERTQQVALWRYQLIREAADVGLSTRQRGRLVRRLAESVHVGPFGEPVRVSRATLDRWIRAWHHGGFEALAPPKRQAEPRTSAQVLELAAALKRENPMRSAAQIERILRTHSGWSPSPRTLQRHFERLELERRPDGRPPAVFGRFEASRPNELWTGDALHGVKITGRKTFLFAFIDDHSRCLVGHRWGYFEDVVRLAAAFRPALAARGIPESIYVDNGSAYVDQALKRAAACLGIKITHSTPGRPQGRGKIERLFRTVREQFLVEIGDDRLSSLAELNTLFTAWVESEYHRRPHAETGQPPLQRWLAGAPFPTPSPAQLVEAFKWSQPRQVSKTAEVKLFSNRYCVDPILIGRTVDLVFDPFDLTVIEVRWNDQPMGLASPRMIGRHSHPKARPETPACEPAATGIDYLHLLADQHQAALARRINYDALASPTHTQTTSTDPATAADPPTARATAADPGTSAPPRQDTPS